jgi:hypothetical protein
VSPARKFGVGDVVRTPDGVGLLEAVDRSAVDDMRYMVLFRDTPERLWRYAKSELTLVQTYEEILASAVARVEREMATPDLFGESA